MKKIILIFVIIVCGVANVIAQSYNEYLNNAYKLLANGDIENAQKNYSVYCAMTGSRDWEFEKKLEEIKSQSNWESKCYIFDISESEILAVQKLPYGQSPVSHLDALKFAENSRLGKFRDWRLPQDSELRIILANIPQNELLYDSYWTLLEKKDVSIKNTTYDMSIFMTTAGERFLLVIRNRLEGLGNIKEYSILKFGNFTILDILKGPFTIYGELSSLVKHNYFIVKRLKKDNIIDRECNSRSRWRR